jgi:hypothetical protein
MCGENWSSCVVRVGCAAGMTIVPLAMFPPQCRK